MAAEAPPTYADLAPVPLEPWITRKELASRMGVSVSTVDALRREGLPYTTWGRRTVRFRPSEALAWAETRGREPSRHPS